MCSKYSVHSIDLAFHTHNFCALRAYLLSVWISLLFSIGVFPCFSLHTFFSLFFSHPRMVHYPCVLSPFLPNKMSAVVFSLPFLAHYLLIFFVLEYFWRWFYGTSKQRLQSSETTLKTPPKKHQLQLFATDTYTVSERAPFTWGLRDRNTFIFAVTCNTYRRYSLLYILCTYIYINTHRLPSAFYVHMVFAAAFM